LSTDKFVEKYKSIFGIPKESYTIMVIIIFSTTISIMNYLIAKFSLFIIIYEAIFVYLISSILSSYILCSILRDSFFNRRRVLGLILIDTVIIGVVEIISIILFKILNENLLLERIYFITCGSIVLFYGIVIGALTVINIKKLFIASIIHPLLMLTFRIIQMKFLEKDYLLPLLSFIIMIIFSFTLAIIYLKYIEKIGKEILGLSTLKLLRGFIEAMMMNKTRLLEKLLKIVSITKDAEIKILDFKGKKISGRIVVPNIHFGPFKKVGSSDLPSKLAIRLKEKGIIPIIFHAPSTHEKDLIFSKECEAIIDSVLSIEHNCNNYGIVSKSIRKKKGDITITCQIFNNIPLVIISRAPIPTEDLPERVNDICMKKIIEKGFSDGIIIDAHNAIDTSYIDFREEDEKNIVETLEECLEELKNSKYDKALVGFSCSKFENYSYHDGFGDGGIMVMVVDVEGQKTAYIVFDGNNMIKGLREEIIAALEKEGYENSEVATTDTHVVVGWKIKEGYIPIGKNIDKEAIIKKVIELVKDANTKKEECSIKFYKINLKNLHFLGNEGLEILWKVTDENIRKAKKTGLIIMIVTILLGIILYHI
jgi:putative membrane protein